MERVLYVTGVFIVLMILSSIRQINQYQRGVKFHLGRFVGILPPGWQWVTPVFQSMVKVDIRVRAVDVPPQEAITQDNVSARIDAVIYYKVLDAGKAVLEVENFQFAIVHLALTAMRDVVGEFTLDHLLSKREEASERIKEIVDVFTLPWGIHVENVALKDIALPEEMKRTIGRQAEAERERRAVIIQSEGEIIAAGNLQQAAHLLAKAPGGLHLRTLNTMRDLNTGPANTIVLTLPLEVLQAFGNNSGVLSGADALLCGSDNDRETGVTG